MSDVYLQIITHLGGIWRRRWHAIAVAWLVCGLGWTSVASLSDRYQSSARVYVDMDTMLGPLMRGMTVEMNLFEQIDIMRRTLLSRPNLEKILLMTDLDLTVKNEADKEKLVDELKNLIQVKQQGRNLFQIAFEDKDKTLAKRVVQAVMQVFVEGNLGASRKDMETTQRFLEGQIRDYERQLIAAEAEMAQFKRTNMGMLPGGGNYYAHMQEVNKQLTEAEARLGEATMIRDEIRAQLADVPQYLETTAAGGVDEVNWARNEVHSRSGPDSGLEIRILELTQAIESLTSRYTEKHPDVMSLKRELESIQKRMAEQNQPVAPEGEGIDAETAKATGKNLVRNSVYEQIKLQLIQQEGVIAALKSRSAEARKQVEKWTSLAQKVPQVEAELAQKTRDYEIIRKGYQELRARQESAKLARDMESKAQKIQFRIVDPPTLPIKPSGPNRPLLMSAVLALGLMAGIAFAFVLSQINTTFISVQRLRSTFILPVLGRVTGVVSPRERRQRVREVAAFAMIATALFFAYGALLTIEVVGAGEAWGTISGFRNLL